MPTSAAFVRTLLEHLQRSHQFSPTIHTIPNGLAAPSLTGAALCRVRKSSKKLRFVGCSFFRMNELILGVFGSPHWIPSLEEIDDSLSTGRLGVCKGELRSGLIKPIPKSTVWVFLTEAHQVSGRSP